MDLMEDILRFIIASGLNYTIGVDAFVCRDSGKGRTLVVNEYAGIPLGDETTTSFRNVQIMVRNKDTVKCWKDIMEIYQLFNRDRFMTIGDRWMQVEIRQTPFKIGYDDARRISFAFNMQITTFYREV